jgi:hypothetical protein
MYLRNIARELIQNASPRRLREAQVALTELGIPEAQHQDFARWLQNYDRAPDIAALQDNRMGELWTSAIYRFVNQVNQAPTTSEKPIGAQSSYGKMVFGLMSFNYSFFTNVMDRYLREIERQWGEAPGAGAKAGAAGRLAYHGALGVAGLVLASLLGSIVRESVFNGDTWDDHKKKGDLLEWLVNLAMQRSGLGGTVDPLIQLYHGLRYNKSVAGLGLGIGGYWAENIQDMSGGVRPRLAAHEHVQLQRLSSGLQSPGGACRLGHAHRPARRAGGPGLGHRGADEGHLALGRRYLRHPHGRAEGQRRRDHGAAERHRAAGARHGGPEAGQGRRLRGKPPAGLRG